MIKVNFKMKYNANGGMEKNLTLILKSTKALLITLKSLQNAEKT